MTLPEKFTARLRQHFPQHAEDMIGALHGESPVSIRCNTRKSVIKDSSTERVPWCENAYYLQERPSFTFDPCFHAGAYYVQEASSMFLAYLFDQLGLSNKEGLKVLDLCAAPGGKSTLILDKLHITSCLVSNEVIRNRYFVLLENIIRSGHCNVIVTNADPAQFSEAGPVFDVVVVDAPCSGEGMFRKDKNAIAEWSEKNVAMCSLRQRRILQHAWDSLVPGGILIYSTCTFEPEENEDQIAYLLSGLHAEPIPLSVPSEWKIEQVEVGEQKCFYFLPHLAKGEGFFCTAMRKPLEGKPREVRTAQGKWQPIENHFYAHSASTVLYAWKETMKLVPGRQLFDLYQHLEKWVKLQHVGVDVCEMNKAGEWEPHIYAPFAFDLELNGLPELALRHTEAIQYLKRESLPGDFSELPRGWLQLNYEKFPIGLAKNIVNRLNNGYPKEWRILSNKYIAQDPLVLRKT